MKVAIITTSIKSEGGGVAEVALQHLEILRPKGEIRLFSADNSQSSVEDGIHSCGRFFKGKFSYFPKMHKMLAEYKPNIVHQHGIWNYLSVQGNQISKKAKLVVSPHGMLDKWIIDNKKIQKDFLSLLFQRRNILKASMVHALTESEAEDIRKYGFRGPIAVVPNGITSTLPSYSYRNLIPNEKLNKFLYLGRIDKKKRVKELCLAFKNLHERGIGIEASLDIFGWGDEKYIREIEKIISSEPKIKFHGPVFGREKIKAFEKADFFILPSLSEGLPMAVLEAWSFALPTILSKNCNLDIGFRSNASLITGTNIEEIYESIIAACRLDADEYSKMSGSALKLAKSSFDFSHIGESLWTSYLWLEGHCDKPSFIHCD